MIDATETPNKNTWFKFFPSDWQGDELLSLCSMAARGFLAELICIMHKAVPYGHLLVNGTVPTDVELMRLTRATGLGELRRLRSELVTRGVLSARTDGVLFSRRMVRKGRQSALAQEYGKRGGNPALVQPLTHSNDPPLSQSDGAPLTAPLTGRDNTQKLEARSQKLEARSQIVRSNVREVQTPVDHRSKRPIFTGQRFVVFDWMLDDLRKLLGKHTDSFDLHEWFFTLDAAAEREDAMIPQRDGGQWLQAKTIEEAQRRGLKLAVLSTRPDPLARSMFAPGTSTEELAAALKGALTEKRR